MRRLGFLAPAVFQESFSKKVTAACCNLFGSSNLIVYTESELEVVVSSIFLDCFLFGGRFIRVFSQVKITNMPTETRSWQVTVRI